MAYPPLLRLLLLLPLLPHSSPPPTRPPYPPILPMQDTQGVIWDPKEYTFKAAIAKDALRTTLAECKAKYQVLLDTDEPPKPVVKVDPREASRKWMMRMHGLTYRHRVPDEIPVTDCLPWCLGVAARGLAQRRHEARLEPHHYRMLHEKVVRAISSSNFHFQNILMPPDHTRIRRTELGPLIQGAVSAFTLSVPETAEKPRFEIYGSSSHEADTAASGLEDVWCVVECLADLCGRDGGGADIFVGLYDGHRGIECAEFARDHLHYYIGTSAAYPTDVPRAFREAFHRTHHEFTTRFAPASDAGTTALCALLRDDVLWVANAGDSMCVRCARGDAVVMTHMHRPSELAERALVEAKGGVVLWYNDAWRTNGTLSVSRSLGDLSTSAYLSRDAEVVRHDIDFAGDEFFVIATDGLWDWMSPQAVVDFVRQARQVSLCALWLCVCAWGRGSGGSHMQHVHSTSGRVAPEGGPLHLEASVGFKHGSLRASTHRT